AGAAAASNADARLSRVEEQVKKSGEAVSRQLGSITFSGDLRFRYEFLAGQLNASPNAADPAILGNELNPRNRLRVRARLALRGRIGEEFEWGLRFATGSLADAVSGNQTLTDFYNRKPFSLDQAFLAYRPKAVPGLQLQAGKFEAPWMRTELIFDGDLQHEGVAESYSRDFKGKALRNLSFVAWQLPFLERNSALVRNANGTANAVETRRAGRDLVLLGAQLRARFQPERDTVMTLAVADFHFSGTQFITPVQFLGGQLQLPVTVTIPATATTPAQTVTAQVAIPRDLLVAGNANLGLSTATTNAVGRDGRLASGFNLVNVIGRLDLTRSKRFPVALIFDFVTNTQARDVSVAGPGGTTVFLHNDEDRGYWAEVQVGKTRERGDVLFGYSFMRIEKDAVLSPFNFDEFVQASDVRAQRVSFSYAADSRVTLTLTGLFSRRANGLLGPFGATPPGSLNRPTTRLQLDTVFRF
nr:putative porin [Acidobacteriota bacterium]